MIPIALRHLRLPVLLGLVMQCAGCSTQRPVLYPNEHYTTVGDAVAQSDIDACMTRANEYVKAGSPENTTLYHLVQEHLRDWPKSRLRPGQVCLSLSERSSWSIREIGISTYGGISYEHRV